VSKIIGVCEWCDGCDNIFNFFKGAKCMFTNLTLMINNEVFVNLIL